MVFKAFVDLVLDYCTGVNFILNAHTGNQTLSNAHSFEYESRISYEQNKLTAICTLS